MVVDVAEVVALVELEAGQLGDLLDRASEQVALGGDDLAHRDQLALEREQPLQLVVVGVLEHRGLEIVDLVIDAGEDGEEAVRERVEDPVKEELLAVEDAAGKL